jgi:hypothetical protein
MTTALVMVASDSLRVDRLSQGMVAAAAVPRTTKAMLLIMVPPPEKVNICCRKWRQAITQVELDP